MAKSNYRFVGHEYPQEGADLHVKGEVEFIDDIAMPEDTLSVYIQGSTVSRGKIKKKHLDHVKAHKDAILVIDAQDIPGENNIGIFKSDEPVFADKNVLFSGQPVFAVAAQSDSKAKEAASLAQIEFQSKVPIITIEDAIRERSTISADVVMKRGRSTPAINNAAFNLSGSIAIGGQDHFYLESQVCVAVPKENNRMHIYCSTQNIDHVQNLVSRALKIKREDIIVEARQVGGAFGGKKTQCAQWAIIAALVAFKTNKPARVKLDRESDMIMTGKSHDFFAEYKCGFNEQGLIQGVEIKLASRCGCSTDLSSTINDRAAFHVDNAYYLKNITVVSKRLKTDTASNTAFRGSGAPQGVLVIERIIDEIAYRLDLDPLTVRMLNLYGRDTKNITHYGTKIKENILPDLIDELKKTSTYLKRKKAVHKFNQNSPVIKRGIALVPVKVGLSASTKYQSQAVTLIDITEDGFVHLQYAAVDMGQGLSIKIKQIVSEVLQVDPVQVKILPTRSDKIQRLEGCVLSSCIDVNSQAAQIAAGKIKEELIVFAAKEYGIDPGKIKLTPQGVKIGRKTVQFKTLVAQAYKAKVSLSARGEYKAPKMAYNAKMARGRPFHYFCYAGAVCEVAIDSLTGESQVLRADILNDCGESINPAIDLGQIEGGFIQGMGWLTSEELYWDNSGQLTTHSPSTYKIPTCADIPRQFNARIFKSGKPGEDTVYGSKAVGEIPFVLAVSVYSALTQAIAAARVDIEQLPALNSPATPERILLAVNH